MVLPIFQVNAFTDKLFSGNPAEVCIKSLSAYGFGACHDWAYPDGNITP
jgi:hypothetical protein